MTATRSRTTTFTVARVRQVMNSVLDDILALVSRGFLSREEAIRWYDDLMFVLAANVVELFEVQLRPPGGSHRALRYAVRDDGRIQGSTPSGGLDLYFLPTGTQASLVLRYRTDVGDLTEIRRELARRGWTSGAELVSGTSRMDRQYGAGGWGVDRSRVGDWDE